MSASATALPVVAAASARRASSRLAAWVVVVLIALNVAVYFPVRHHQFLALDDVSYVTENRHVTAGLTWAGVAWACTTGHAANWHPVTWLSHMLDVQLFGVGPGPQHLVNVVLHILNTLLLFAVLRQMTGAVGRSAFVAALFAVHPLHVESVAWIAERKDVLSTLFWLLTMCAYLAYVNKPRWTRYGAMLACFALGLMAKPMLVTLPLVLLLLDVWPLGRRRRRTSDGVTVTAGIAPLVLEKLPLFALALASSIITIVVQRRGGAVGELNAFPLVSRVANSLTAYGSYLDKTFWPSRLSVFYPYPSTPRFALAAIVLAGLSVVTVLVLRSVRSRPWFAVGWFWYLVTLVPVIGLVQVGRQSIADRYTYVPLVGVFVIIAWGVPDLLARWPIRRRVLPAAAAIAVLACGVTARAQVGYWQDDITLWTHALAADPHNYYAHAGVAIAASDVGHTAEAERHFAEAIRIAPDYAEAYHGLGVLRAKQGRLDEAIAQYGAAVRLRPNFVEARANMGAALALTGRFADAAVQYREALGLVPDDPRLHAYLGQAFAGQGKLDEAVAEFKQALRLDPRLAFAHDAFGLTLLRLGRVDDAIAHHREAVRLDPKSPGSRNNLANALSARGKADEAIAQYKEALRLDAGLADAHHNLGFALAAQGNVADAIPHFAEAVRLKPDFEIAHYSLGLALGGIGRFADAAAQFNEVLRINPDNQAARRALATLSRVATPQGRR